MDLPNPAKLPAWNLEGHGWPRSAQIAERKPVLEVLRIYSVSALVGRRGESGSAPKTPAHKQSCGYN